MLILRHHPCGICIFWSWLLFIHVCSMLFWHLVIVYGVPSHQRQNNQEYLKLSTFFLIMRHYTWALVCSWFTVHGCSSFSTMLWLFDTSPSCSSNDNFGLNMARMLLARLLPGTCCAPQVSTFSIRIAFKTSKANYSR
jgi:hypothetical protein